MPLFRFLHISDLHIAARPRQLGPLNPAFWSLPSLTAPQGWAVFSSYDDILFDKLVEYVTLHRHLLDFVIVTGDLANTGTDADLAVAQNLLLGASTTLFTLAQAAVPLRLIPGNHDRFPGLPPLGAASTSFDGHFNLVWHAGPRAQYLIGQTRGGAELVCIGADFSLRHHTCASVALGFFGQGQVYHSVLRALKAETARARRAHPSACILWIVHFPPESDGQSIGLPSELQRQIPQMRLDGGDRLLNAAQSYGVYAILAGHIHDWTAYTASNGTRISVAASATEYQAHHGNWLHWVELDIEADGRVNAADVQDVAWNTQFQKWDKFPVTRYLS